MMRMIPIRPINRDQAAYNNSYYKDKPFYELKKVDHDTGGFFGKSRQINDDDSPSIQRLVRLRTKEVHLKMRRFEYSTRYFHPELFMSEHCIVDNEISNDISKDWDYSKGKPIVVGFLHKDKMTIYLAETEDDMNFKEAVINHLRQVKLDGIEMYSFNRHMETGNFMGTWAEQVNIKEIKPFKGKGWNKDRFYMELIAREQIPDCKVADVFHGDASLCITNWAKFQETGKIEYGVKIVQHNMNCLLKESVILNNRQFFLDNFKLDERGWVIE